MYVESTSRLRAILRGDKIHFRSARFRQQKVADLVRRSFLADLVRGKVLPHDHPRPAGVCAGIAMAGNFSCHLHPQKNLDDTPDNYLLWKKYYAIGYNWSMLFNVVE